MGKAISAYSRAIEVFRYDRTLYFQRGYCYLQVSNFQEALADYTHNVEMDPQDAGTWALRGFTYVKLRRPEQAMADYLKAIDCWRVRIERLSRVESVVVKGRPYLWSFASSAELISAGANPAEVRALFQKLEAACRDEVTALQKRHGPTHQNTEAARSVLAQFLRDQGKLAEAEEVRQE